MNRMLRVAIAGFVCGAIAVPQAPSACCYFSAVGQDVNQPAQKAFITWDPQERIESFTVQPKFEGNAVDFGMVIPTPSQPKLDEMPRDFFQALAVYTILRPMPIDKYKMFPRSGAAFGEGKDDSLEQNTVRVLEEGVVGSLEYKIVEADRADDLFHWLAENEYSYAGDEATLDFYVQKRWYFTVMKIDPKQMKRKPDGSYSGDVTPTRFTFSSERPVYPLRITSLSVNETTEALFYVAAPYKTDLAGPRSHRYRFLPMWHQAMNWAVPEKMTQDEKDWKVRVDRVIAGVEQNAERLERPGTTLEWAKKLDANDIRIATGEAPYGREAPPEEIAKLKFLVGHLQEGMFLTKFRRVFAKYEMTDDLEIVPARIGDAEDTIPYYEILPTSPP